MPQVKKGAGESRELLSGKGFAALLVLQLAGQLAWAVENQFYNTFMYDRITPDPRAVSWMVSVTAVVSTLTAILMGTASDRSRSRWGRRRPFIFAGYVLWGLFTASFPAAASFQPVALGVFMAILLDSIMSFFGATASDAALSSYVADATTAANRGRVSGALQIMTWIATLVVYGGAGFLIKGLGYTGFFCAVGGFALVAGLAFAPLLPEPPAADSDEPKRGYWAQIADTFHLRNLVAERDLFLLLLSLTLFMVSINIFFPYLMIYLQHYAKLGIVESSVLIGAAIVVGGIGAALPVGALADRWGRRPVAMLAVAVESAGLVLFSLARSLPALVLGGIVWLGAYTAWTVATGAWTKDLFPEDKRGQFSGYFILFNVAFTMIPGSLLGGWLSSAHGLPAVIDGKAGTTPTPLIFQVAAGLVLLALVPLSLMGKANKAKRGE